MKKYLITLFAILFSVNTFASTVRLSDTTEPVVNVGNIYSVYNTLGGDGTSSSAPLKLYIPLSGSGTTQSDNHILKTALFKSNSTQTLNTTIDIVNTDSVNVLYPTLYVKDDSSTNYLFVGRSTIGCSTSSTCEDVISSFSIATICNSTEIDCAGALSAPVTVSSYLYLSQAGVDTSISDPTSGSDGLFVELNISGRVYESTVTTALTSIEKGDQRLKLNYTVSAIQNDYRDIAIFDVSSFNSKFGQAGINEILSIDDDVTPQSSGLFEAKNLSNGRTYNISFAVRDFYGFYTPLASPLSATPLEIAEFLEKNQCYFISAGFMEQHYVLNYFRYIRDHYLLKVKLGQSFVDFYYETAPQYVPFIIERPWLQALIRGFAYSVYFIFNFSLVALMISVMVIFLTSKVFKNSITE
ncbi:hypothetical protein BIY24_10715 [Halobacteriovorax marinus]|uniref:CFI-box-CTERM domain-containing protein n=1 Tax=Halobacteriovorax marinus TaxID=97084 RepID=UPI000BC2E395|nr:CFI-box-CTERM domain-containing protein [Halobacteriovorax marinus]ATH08402.1 hypothetical protein BIY24_10715 [Halobacteriovorax marinus]